VRLAFLAFRETQHLEKASHVASKSRQRRQRGLNPSSRYGQRVGGLIRQRDDLMTEIALVRARASGPLPLLNKARALLTRFWSAASWDAREEILRTAAWLVSVGKMQHAGSPPKGRKGEDRHGPPIH
jgi:hypothetical protein